jgi:hypothetical protein
MANHTRSQAPELSPNGFDNGGHARDFMEVEKLIQDGVSFEDGFESWLREMYLYRLESFFAVPPSLFFDPRHRAWMAGASEGLTRMLDIPSPSWIDDQEFFLHDIWDCEREALGIFFLSDLAETLEARLERSDPEFRRRRVIAHLRGLIRV